MTVSVQSHFRLIGRPDPPVLAAYPWRRSSRYVVPSADNFGFLSALNTAITTDSLYWGVNFSDFVGATQSMELKRIGSPPPGELSTARVLFFTSTPSPAPAAGAVGDAASTSFVYSYLAIDGNTTSSGPPQSFTVGDPYNTSVYTTLGRQCLGSITANSSLWFAENELGIAWNMSVGAVGSGSSKCGFFGRFWDDFTGVPGWAMGASIAAIDSTMPTIESSQYAIWACASLSNNNRIVGIKNGSATRYDLGRVHDGPFPSNGINNSGLYGGGLHSVFLGGRVRGSGSSFQNMGRLHQFKYGPNVPDRYTTSDGSVGQTIVISPSTAASSPSIHLDSLRS